jgi:hypothetical protein
MSMLLFIPRAPAIPLAAELPPPPLAFPTTFLVIGVAERTLETSLSPPSTPLLPADALDDDDEADPSLARALDTLADIILAMLETLLPRLDEADLWAELCFLGELLKVDPSSLSISS